MGKEINGVIIIDKPERISSADVVARTKRTLGVKKVGHAGTLDPMATGVLVCCLNKGTRLARFLLKGEKSYRTSLRLGVETDTQDATGEVTVARPYDTVTASDIQLAVNRFTGRISQVPPAYSALKHQGVPLYELARRGTPVQKPAREVTVFSIRVLGLRIPDIDLDIRCSAGTYIRTLCADIGEQLGCGAHMRSLRRMAGSGFSIAEAITLDELADLARDNRATDRIIGMTEALRGMPEHIADAALTEKIRYGKPVSLEDMGAVPIKMGYIKITDERTNLLAVVHANAADGEVRYNYCGVFAAA